MVETITRLYHCHKIHKHVTVYEEYEVSGRTSFDSDFYITFPDSTITELENNGCITIVNDIVGSICLTEYGYQESKK